MAYQYSEELPAEATRRYSLKLQHLGQDTCPYKVAADRWVNEPKLWPSVQYHDIYHYLIKHPRLYSTEAMESYRSLDAYRFFVSGWVGLITFIKTNTGLFIFRADVKPSWRVTEDPHHPWVAIHPSGPVAAAHCDCMAGLGETCSHIGAVLFKIEAAIRLGYTSSACTDEPCAWNACFMKKVTGSRIADVQFYKEASKKKLVSPAKVVKVVEPSTEAEQEQLLSALADLESTKVVGLSSWAKYADRFAGTGPKRSPSALPRPLSLLYKESNLTLSTGELDDLCTSTCQELTISEEQVKNVEAVTRAQSSSSVWFTQRYGRITASLAGDALRTDPDNPARSLLKKICQEKQSQLNVPAVIWGKEHEVDAYQLYDTLYTNSGPSPKVLPTGVVYMTNPGPHQQCTVCKSGLFIAAETPFLGASPDALVKCTCCGSGVVEIKSPFSLKTSELKGSVLKEKLGLDPDTLELGSGHKYFAQVQMQIYACGVSYADLVIWTPLDCIITRVVRHEQFISSMVEKLGRLWETAVLPELLTKRLQQDNISIELDKENVQPTSGSAAQDNNLYCVCRGPAEGDMVGCDKCDEWFHFPCLGLKRLPTTKTWYCPNCRKSIKKLK